LEEYEKRKVILKAKFSSSITSGGKNRAWQEIANIVNARNSVKRDIKGALATIFTKKIICFGNR
jgi:hypothetical protein